MQLLRVKIPRVELLGEHLGIALEVLNLVANILFVLLLVECSQPERHQFNLPVEQRGVSTNAPITQKDYEDEYHKCAVDPEGGGKCLHREVTHASIILHDLRL